MIVKTILLIVIALVAAGSSNSARTAEQVEATPTRPGVTMKFIVRNETTGNPPIVILFTGGDGIIKLDSWNGKGNPASNFLVRTRKHFARNKLLAVVPDAPSDLQTDGLSMLRTSKDDTCYVTLFSDIPDLAKRFVNAPSVTIKGYTGGGNYWGDECAARTAHGFRGIEKRVVKDIADWIKKVTARAKP